MEMLFTILFFAIIAGVVWRGGGDQLAYLALDRWRPYCRECGGRHALRANLGQSHKALSPAQIRCRDKRRCKHPDDQLIAIHSDIWRPNELVATLCQACDSQLEPGFWVAKIDREKTARALQAENDQLIQFEIDLANDRRRAAERQREQVEELERSRETTAAVALQMLPEEALRREFYVESQKLAGQRWDEGNGRDREKQAAVVRRLREEIERRGLKPATPKQFRAQLEARQSPAKVVGQADLVLDYSAFEERIRQAIGVRATQIGSIDESFAELRVSQERLEQAMEQFRKGYHP
jgi:hypothetical protein